MRADQLSASCAKLVPQSPKRISDAKLPQKLRAASVDARNRQRSADNSKSNLLFGGLQSFASTEELSELVAPTEPHEHLNKSVQQIDIAEGKGVEGAIESLGGSFKPHPIKTVGSCDQFRSLADNLPSPIIERTDTRAARVIREAERDPGAVLEKGGGAIFVQGRGGELRRAIGGTGDGRVVSM